MVWDACVGYRGHKSVLNFHYIPLIAGYKERERDTSAGKGKDESADFLFTSLYFHIS